MADRRTVRRAASKSSGTPSLIASLISGAGIFKVAPSPVARGGAHRRGNMHTGGVLQDGATARPRNDAGLHVGADAVGAAIDGELGIGGFFEARQHIRWDHNNRPIAQLDGAPGIKAAARALGRGEML